jgi:hypothetical protein
VNNARGFTRNPPKRGFDILCYFTTIYGVIHDVVSRRSFYWFLLTLVDVDLHSVIFSIPSPIIMIGISNATVPSLESSTASVDGNLPPSSVPSLEPSFDLSYVPSLILSSIPSREPISETSAVPSLDPTLISSTTTVRRLLSSTVPSLKSSLISRTNTVQCTLSSPLPSLEPSLISSTNTVQSSLSSPVTVWTQV